jgi:hypothetical protein
MPHARNFVVAVAALMCCRTEVIPTARQERSSIVTVFRANSQGCDVLDYPSATDVPQGAAPLGWVQVQRQPTDDETYVALRQAICAKGGNALSQMLWTREEGEKELTLLRANAWKIPVR